MELIWYSTKEHVHVLSPREGARFRGIWRLQRPVIEKRKRWMEWGVTPLPGVKRSWRERLPKAGAVPKYTVASVAGEKGTKARSRGRLHPPHSDFRRGFIPRGAEKWSLWPLNVVTTPLKELAPNEV